jgi:hypothetical protein
VDDAVGGDDVGIENLLIPMIEVPSVWVIGNS